MSRLVSCLSAACSNVIGGGEEKTSGVLSERSGLEVVLDKYQVEKNIFIQTVWEDNTIFLCNEDGIVLKSIALNTSEWSACSLPGHADCICLKYREQDKVELILKSRSQHVVERVLMELEQCKALGISMRGVVREEQDELHDLKRKVSELCEELGKEQEKNRMLERTCHDIQAKQASRHAVSPPLQIKTCLARIDELESRNTRLDEDLRIQVRQTKKVAHQLKMVQIELARCEEEKVALLESLTQCHVRMSDIQHDAASPSPGKEGLKGGFQLHSRVWF